MNADKMFESDYMKAADFDTDVSLTIKSIETAEIGQGKKAEQKWIVYFTEMEKGLVLNVTNKNVIKGMHGQDTDDWIGKRITLYPTEVEYQGDMVPAIRVRLKTPNGPASPHHGQQSHSHDGPPADAPPAAATAAPPSPRIVAWSALVRRLPSFSSQDRSKAWLQALKEVYPTKTQEQLSPEEWGSFTKELNEKLMEDGSLCPI